MATTTTLNTRIKLRYDTYSNWYTKNPILLQGEVAVVAIPSNQSLSSSAPTHSPVNENSYKPTILFKVGIAPVGTENTAANQELYGFNALEWASGLAADVYAWAKKSAAETGDGMKVTGFEAPGQDDDFVDLTSKNNASLNSVIQELLKRHLVADL